MKYLDERGLAYFYQRIKSNFPEYDDSQIREMIDNLDSKKLDMPLCKSGNPVVFDNLDGNTPFFDVIINGENIAGEELVLSVSGENKNLLPFPYYDISGKISGGVCFTTDEYGVITMNGNASEDSYFTLYDGSPVLFDGIVYISVVLSSFIGWYYSICYEFYKNNVCVESGSFTGAGFNISSDYDRIVLKLKIDSGASLSDIKAYCQIEYGNAATAFEPFVSDKYTIFPDSSYYRIPFSVKQLEGKNILMINNSSVSLDVYSDNNNAAFKRMYQQICSLENNKLDKETGKGLSSNDYTDDEKEKLAALENYDDTMIKSDIANKVDNDIFVAENMIKYPYNAQPTSSYGVTFEYDDGTITLNGTSTKDITINLHTHFYLQDGIYAFSANSTNLKVGLRFYGHDADGNSQTLKTAYGNNIIIYDTTNDGYSEYSLNLKIPSVGAEFVNDTCKPMFEIGNVAHAYQPYSLSRKAMRDDINTLMALLT
ncbi:MAG: hypothetical protein ACI4JM_06670 [Oscillospiraceae bacterium]